MPVTTHTLNNHDNKFAPYVEFFKNHNEYIKERHMPCAYCDDYDGKIDLEHLINQSHYVNTMRQIARDINHANNLYKENVKVLNKLLSIKNKDDASLKHIANCEDFTVYLNKCIDQSKKRYTIAYITLNELKAVKKQIKDKKDTEKYNKKELQVLKTCEKLNLDIDDYKCAICCEVVDVPYKHDTCKHSGFLTCLKCLSKIPKCPMCRKISNHMTINYESFDEFCKLYTHKYDGLLQTKKWPLNVYY